jgi:hypothetical protein
VERVEAERRADEQKKEKSNAEHEEMGIVANKINEINERLGLQKRIDQSVLDRVNSLAEISM